MSQDAHPLDNFRSMIEDGVDDAEIAKMAEVSVTQVRKYKARMKQEAKAAEEAAEAEAETEPAAEEPPAAPEPPAKAKPARKKAAKADIVQRVRDLATAHPKKLVLRLTHGFGIRTRSPRTGKPTTMPVIRSDYKGGMAVRIAMICVEHGYEDKLVLMDPNDESYPPSPVPPGVTAVAG